MKVTVKRRDIGHSGISALRATANTSAEQRQAEFGQSLGNAAQAMGQSSDVFEQIKAKKNAYELNINMQERQADFDELINLMRYDKSITNFDEAFEQKSKEIYQKGRESLTLPGMQRDFDAAFDQAKQSYLNQVRAVSADRTMSDGALAGQTVIQNMLTRVGTTGESVWGLSGEVSAFLVDSPFYSPEQKKQMLADFNAKAIDAAMTGRIQGAFNAAEGDYLAKGDAARDALLSQDIGELTAAQQEKYFSQINSLVSREHTVQGWREKESDDQKYEGFNELFMYGTRTGNFLAAKQYCHDADTFNESLPITWLKMIEAEEARLASGEKYKVPEAVFAEVAEIAMNPNRDEAWKQRQYRAIADDVGVPPSEWDSVFSYGNKLAENFQNPIFQLGQKEIAAYFEPLIEDGKQHDNLKGAELQKLYNQRTMAWNDVLMNGLTAQEAPQVIANFMDETKKLAIELEFEMKNGINSLADVNPENMDRVKNLPEMIQFAHDGRIRGMRGEYNTENYEVAYSSAMDKVGEQGAIPGLQRVGSQYLEDATPRYIAEIGGAKTDVRMMPDGSMQYWMDYGDGTGEWAGLEYDYINPLEAKEMQPKVQTVGDPVTIVEEDRDYRMPPYLSKPETLPWSEGQSTEFLGKEFELQGTPAMHDALRDEIIAELENGDFNVFGQIRNKVRNDWEDRYHLNPAELRDIIRAVKEEE